MDMFTRTSGQPSDRLALCGTRRKGLHRAPFFLAPLSQQTGGANRKNDYDACRRERVCERWTSLSPARDATPRARLSLLARNFLPPCAIPFGPRLSGDNISLC